MQTELSNEPLIDPEVKAFVFSLVSALGGCSAGDDGRYILGDDALAVLKDIKRWLRLYDDKLNRLDVSRLLADADLVKGDLLEILASWPEDAPEESFRSKIALLCVDLLTQLTWPIEQDVETATIARYLHVPSLQKAQASYKAAIINHPTTKMLRTVARVCLPALAQPREERSPQEDTIIKVVLYFFRNIAMITQPTDIAIDDAESGVDRSTTIDEFHYQDTFSLILAICSNMHEDYSTHDVELLDVIFHLVKGVDTDNLFMEEQEIISANTQELKTLMGEEKGMYATYARHAPSRHNRFGTMLWVGRDGGRRSTLFGQKALGNEQLSMNEMDQLKKWKRPRRPTKKDTELPQSGFDAGVRLTTRAKRHLRSFVEQFLDSSFNPLFLAVRRAIEREAPRVLPQQHMRQYLYLISWFLRAESARRKKQASDRFKRQSLNSTEVESFTLVAAVLNQETFVLLNRSMQVSLDEKKWQDLNAGMKCFTQILLTVQEMSDSPLDEDQEIAENILNRIFYEQTTHDRIIALLRSYKDQDFGYLDACTELSHVFLRLLERYSKQNVDMQVRSRRRARKKKRVVEPSNEPSAAVEEREQEVEDVADAQRTVSERKFDFHRFSARFINQVSVDTFVALLRHYKDLKTEQLKRAHRFFYRIAFKMDLTVFLFRMDIIQLLNKLVKGPDGLNVENGTFKEWEELVRQVFRRLIKRLEERPALAVELLFSKIPGTMFYLEHGYDKEVEKKTLRAAAELEVKPGTKIEEQIGIAVSILINQSKSDALAWVKQVLDSAASERKAWEEANIALRSTEATGDDGSHSEPPQTHKQSDAADATDAAQQSYERAGEHWAEAAKAPLIFVKADNPERAKALHQDKHLRLLLTTLAFERIAFEADTSETTWLIPSALSPSVLLGYRDLIAKFEFDLPTFEEGKSAEDMVRRKQAPRPPRPVRNEQAHDDSEGSTGTDIEESLFPAGGPTLAPAAQKAKKRLLKRQKRSADETIDPEILEARRNAKQKTEAEKNAKIKSALYIRDSDDESDEERDRLFFAREQAMRDRVAAHGGNLGYMNRVQKPKGKGKGKKRSSAALGSQEDDAITSEAELALPISKKRRKAPARAILLSEDDSDVLPAQEDDGSAAMRLREGSPPPLRSSTTNSGAEANDSSAETDTETPPSSQPPSTGHPSVARVSGKVADAFSQDDELDFAESGSDKENAPKVLPMPARRSVRAGFIIESDSDD